MCCGSAHQLGRCACMSPVALRHVETRTVVIDSSPSNSLASALPSTRSNLGNSVDRCLICSSRQITRVAGRADPPASPVLGDVHAPIQTDASVEWRVCRRRGAERNHESARSEHRLDRRRVCEIGRHGMPLTEAGDRIDRRLGSFAIRPVVDHDTCTSLVKPDGDRPPDAARRPCHRCGPPLQVDRHHGNGQATSYGPASSSTGCQSTC